jgi:hypothetical protein
MKTIDDIRACSAKFFARHWHSDLLGHPVPAWKAWEPFLSGSIPHHDLAGCYALFRGEELQYVGKGDSKGGGAYPNHGLSRRIDKHVTQLDRNSPTRAILAPRIAELQYLT